MANVETEEQPVKRPIKFDLSDGLQKEDIIALGSGLLHVIIFILTILLYPFIWIYRELGRLRNLLFIRTSRPLSPEEVRFISSWPLFLSTIGLSLGLLLGVIVAVTDTEQLINRIRDVADIFGWLIGLIVGFFQFIRDLLVGIWGLLVGLKNFVITDIFNNTDFILIPFFALSAVGFILMILILFFIESKYINKAIKKFQDTFAYFLTIPRRFYNYLDQKVWNFLLVNVGLKFVGGNRIQNHDSGFYRKVLLFSGLFSILTFIAGLLLFRRFDGLGNFGTNVDKTVFLMVILFFAGGFSGFVVTTGLVFILDRIARRKYALRFPGIAGIPLPATTSTESIEETEISDSKGKIMPKTPAATPVPPKRLTAEERKERARARRQARKQIK